MHTSASPSMRESSLRPFLLLYLLLVSPSLSLSFLSLFLDGSADVKLVDTSANCPHSFEVQSLARSGCRLFSSSLSLTSPSP
jgi:hypothetical protein